MLLPDESPRSYATRQEELHTWAKLESKSESTEHDLLRSHRRRERVSWRSICAFVLHFVHVAFSSGERFE